MIYYPHDLKHTLCRLFQVTGSTVPKAFLIALLAGTSAGVLQKLEEDGRWGGVDILRQTQPFGGFSFLVGFLVVFKTSQASSRFWEGCTAAHKMRAEWWDACSSVVAFTRRSNCTSEVAQSFNELFIRLTSMMHAAALAELEREYTGIDQKPPSEEDQWAVEYSLLDPHGVDPESLRTVRDSTDRVELLFVWIQQLIVENIDTGVLNIPPPLLSRSFQELAAGMVHFHNAKKIACISIPFPYAQTTEWLLILHTLIVPVVTAQWVTHHFWTFVFTFIQVAVLWSLHFVAMEIENPFGYDDNDLDGRSMQVELNRHLKMLLAPSTQRTPTLVKCCADKSRSTFQAVFAEVERSKESRGAGAKTSETLGSLMTATGTSEAKLAAPHSSNSSPATLAPASSHAGALVGPPSLEAIDARLIPERNGAAAPPVQSGPADCAVVSAKCGSSGVNAGDPRGRSPGGDATCGEAEPGKTAVRRAEPSKPLEL